MLCNRLVTTDQDRDAITALHTLCFDPKTQGPPLQVALDDENCFAFLGEGGVGGYIVCRIQDKESELLWVGVIPEHRGEGCGRSLISAALNESRIRGVETMDLYVAEDNNSAIHLYKSLGFVDVDTHAGFYANIQGGADDAIIMRVSLIKSEKQENESQIYLATTDQDKDTVIALHTLCFNSAELPKLEVALDDESYFAILGGCDEDGQPTGYGVARVQDKSSIGPWFGVRSDRLHLKRNRFRTKELGRALMRYGFTEARARGAEYMDAQVLSDNRNAFRLHKEEGWVLVNSFLDYVIIDGKRVECTNNHFRRSLITGEVT